MTFDPEILCSLYKTCSNSQGHIDKDSHCDIMCNPEKTASKLKYHLLNIGKIYQDPCIEPCFFFLSSPYVFIWYFCGRQG